MGAISQFAKAFLYGPKTGIRNRPRDLLFVGFLVGTVLILWLLVPAGSQ